MGGLVQTTNPSGKPLTITEVKSFLRIDFNEDDIFLIGQLTMVTDVVEKYLRSALISRTYELAVDKLPEREIPLREGLYVGPFMSYPLDYIDLPFSPVVSVSSIKTFDDQDNETVVNSAKYLVDTFRKPARVILRNGETWPNATREANALIITYTAGYGTASQVPEAIRLAMLQLIAYSYEHRGDQIEGAAPAIPESIQTLLRPYQMMNLGKRLL